MDTSEDLFGKFRYTQKQKKPVGGYVLLGLILFALVFLLVVWIVMLCYNNSIVQMSADTLPPITFLGALALLVLVSLLGSAFLGSSYVVGTAIVVPYYLQ